MAKNLILLDKPDTPRGAVGSLKGEPKLKSLQDIRSEMSKIYRACFYRKVMNPEDFSRAIYGLRTIAELIEASAFEDRLKNLEGDQ